MTFTKANKKSGLCHFLSLKKTRLQEGFVNKIETVRRTTAQK